MSRHRAAGTLRTRQVPGRCLDGDRVFGDADEPGDRPADLVKAEPEPRPGTDDRHINGARHEACACHPLDDRGQQLAARHALRRPRVRRKQAPEIALAACTQQRVRNRVEDDVAVGVAEQSRCVRERDTAKGQRSVGPERVGVIAEADTGAREVAAERVLDAGEVGRERHFDVARVA